MTRFHEGDEVLVRGVEKDQTYFGIIVEIDLEVAECLVYSHSSLSHNEASFKVRFGDCTETWSGFNALRRLDDDEDDLGHDLSQNETDEDDPGPPELDLCGDPALVNR